MGMELLSPIDEYYIQLSYYSLIAIFQKTGFMHIRHAVNSTFSTTIFSYQYYFLIKIYKTTFVLRCATKILKIGK